MTLANVKNGQSVRVIEVKEDYSSGNEESLRLNDMGIVLGQKINVIKRAPLGDPLQIELLGYQLCLRKQQADCIEVEPFD